MTPSGLYRYFDDHGALLAALCVDAHESLRATLVRAQTAHDDDDTMTQWFRGSVVMRRWAVDHVDEYAMVVGPRLSGVDPEHPDLVAAIARLMSIPVDTVAAGDLERRARAGSCPGGREPAPPSANGRGPGVLREARTIATGAVSALVGAVSLEAFGHLSGADRADEYAAYSLQVMRGMGWVETPRQCRAGARGVLSRQGPCRPGAHPAAGGDEKTVPRKECAGGWGCSRLSPTSADGP